MDKLNNDDWYCVCSEKNIILESNYDNSNLYKLYFNTNNTTNITEIIDIIKDGEFFKLICELNKDIIYQYDIVNVNEQNQLIQLNLKNDIKNKELDIKIYLNINIIINHDNNSCIITSNNSNLNTSTNKEIYLHDFKITIEEYQNKPQFVILFGIDDVFNTDIIRLSLALYLKKIFYKLKLYFD